MFKDNQRKRNSNVRELSGGRQWLTNNEILEIDFLKAADLESAAYMSYRARAALSVECLRQQKECLATKQSKRFSSRNADFLENNCHELMSLSCSIESKGPLNTPIGTRCIGSGVELDCSEKFDIKSSCTGQTGYTLPGCKGFRSDEEAMINSCSSNWSHRADREQQYRQYWKDRVNPNDPSVFDQPPEKGMCARLAFNDPKVLRMIKNELNYSP